MGPMQEGWGALRNRGVGPLERMGPSQRPLHPRGCGDGQVREKRFLTGRVMRAGRTLRWTERLCVLEHVGCVIRALA